MHRAAEPLPWWSDHEMDAGAAAAAAGAVLPAEGPWEAEALGEGWDFRTFLARGAARDLVLRFPKRAQCVAWLARETLLLERIAPLADSTGVALPLYVVRMARAPGVPHPFGAYPPLPGAAVDRASLGAAQIDGLAADVGRFAAALHRLPLSVLPAGAHPTSDADEATAWRNLLEVLRPVLGGARATACAGLLERLSRYARGPRVPLHTDLLVEHLLVDAATGALAAVLDWTDAQPGARAGDLAGLFAKLGEGALAAALDAYEPPDREEMAQGARFLGLRLLIENVHVHGLRGHEGGVARNLGRIDEVLATQ